jgi:predicted MFS family arabinose efflux permease
MYIVAPAMTSSFGWQSVWWLGAAFALLAFVLVWFFMRTPPQMASKPDGGVAGHGEAPDLKKALSNRSIWLLGAMFGCFTLALLAVSTFLPTFLNAVRGYTLANASFTASLSMITVLFSAPLAGILSDKIGSRKVLFTWPLIVVAIMMLFPFTVTGGTIPLWNILLGVFAGIPAVIYAAAPEIMGKPELAGMGMAVLGLGQNLGMIIGPAIFGALVQSSGWAVAGYWMIPVLLFGLLAGCLVKVR